MSSADDVQAMLDDVYGVAGVACAWTPAGGAAVAFTGLELGGDQAARLRGLITELNVAAYMVEARASELAALAPNAVPTRGDLVTTPAGSFVICADPLQPDPRRLKWLFELDPA